MLSNRFLTGRFLLSLLVALFVFPSATFGQFGLNQKSISTADWSRGFHGFNMLAEGNELERISIPQFQTANSADVLLVVIGNLENLPLNLANHINNGGTVLLASENTEPNVSFAGFRFAQLSEYPTDDTDAFNEMRDCPIVSDFRPHPIVTGVDTIVTNRPGYLLARLNKVLARLPQSYRQIGLGSFIAARESSNGSRAVAVADPSIFTNQMIIFGNNALFANQTFKWLKNDRLKKVLVLVDGNEYTAIPSDVVVDMPAPSKDEVLDVLNDLPASAMLDFANSVATVVEDENMVNDFLRDSMEKIPQNDLNRFYIFLLFFFACLSFILAFLFQRKLQRETASDVAYKQSNQEQAEMKVIQSRERQEAAHILLDRFCMDLAGTRFSSWPSFPTGLNVDQDRQSKNLFKSMTKMSVLYKSKTASFWTRSQLAKLEKQVGVWRAYFKNRPEFVKPEDLQHNNVWVTNQRNEFN